MINLKRTFKSALGKPYGQTSHYLLTGFNFKKEIKGFVQTHYCIVVVYSTMFRRWL